MSLAGAASRQNYVALASVSASVTGLILWFALAARPYAGDAGADDHLPLFFGLLGASALVLGALWRRACVVVPFALVIPQVVVAPFSAPRGDGDGLWILILAYFVMVFPALVAVSWAGARATEAVVNRLRATRGSDVKT